MGSSQSSNSTSFSVDPSGNIKARRDSNAAFASSSSSSEAINSAHQSKKPSPELVVEPTIPDITSSNIKTAEQSPKQQAKMQQQHQRNAECDLAEIDKTVTHLKSKYKPTAEKADNKKIDLEEKERNLAQCYRTKRPLDCQEAFKDYKNYVAFQRNQVLKKSLDTMLVLIVCILLHITTVSCFGAMSIDLGSEWMKVGLVAPSVQMDIVLNAQSQRKTAMAVAFSNGERYVGDIAMDVASKYPEKTYTHFLDLVGKSLDHESVKHYKQRFPYANITSHEPNSTSILLNHPEGLSFTPLELIAMMLKHAHEQVVSVLNTNEPASDVVITVPPFFNLIERRVILDAAKLAGLNVLRLTNVNSAFALSYGIFRHKDYVPESSENRTSIIFLDQGASHTSVTLADYHLVEQIDPLTGQSKNESIPTVTIRAQVYDRYLGGFDMQLKLRDYLAKTFAEKEKIDETRIYKRGRSIAKLLKEAGRVKKVLSANTDFTVRVENVIDDKDLKQPITRQEFEALNTEYISKKLVKLLDQLFEMPSVNRDDPIESVIIVGGNTRTPKIQQVLMDYFKLDTLGKSINADEGAALAALYQAASLGRGFRVKKFILEEFGEERKIVVPTPGPVDDAQSIEPTPATEQVSTEPTDSQTEPSVIDATTTTPEPSTTSPTTTPDPNALYSESELRRIKDKLSQLNYQDQLRLRRDSLRNAIESLLSEGREKLDEETANWLDNASQSDLMNVTLLAEKYDQIYKILYVPPPKVFNFTETIALMNETLRTLNETVFGFTNNITSAADNETSPALNESTPVLDGPAHTHTEL